MAQSKNYVCPKCNNDSYTTGQIRAAGGFWSKLFDVQTAKYTAVSCKRCKYTEFYKGTSGLGSNLIDFMTGG